MISSLKSSAKDANNFSANCFVQLPNAYPAHTCQVPPNKIAAENHRLLHLETQVTCKNWMFNYCNGKTLLHFKSMNELI